MSRMINSKASRGGIGTNQYQVRGHPRRRSKISVEVEYTYEDSLRLLDATPEVSEVIATQTTPLLYEPALRGDAPPLRTKQDAYRGARFYKSPRTEEWYPSVTSVLKVVNSPELERWKMNQLLDMLYSKAEDGSLIDYLRPPEGRTWSSWRGKILEDATDTSAADRGTVVHSWAEARAAQELGYDVSLPAVSEEDMAWCKKWDEWRSKHDIRWLGLELTCFNETLRYAGTADYLAVVDGVVVMGDYKTSKHIRTSYDAQLAALSHCEYTVDKDGALHQLPEIERCDIVQLRPMGKDQSRPADTVAGWKQFSAMRALWDAYV